jgi:Phosphodiester glycosidase
MFAMVVLRGCRVFGRRSRSWLEPGKTILFVLGFQIGMGLVSPAAEAASSPDLALPGLLYTNHRVPEVPWSIHIVQVARGGSAYELHSVHAKGRAIGLTTLRAQVASIDPSLGSPVAGVNGDFYQRDKAYAGDPRGLQVVEGEVISAPSGGASLWTDPLGDLHATNVASLFQITWPDGTATPFDLNGTRHTNGVEVYTWAMGASTLTPDRGLELVLEKEGDSPWLPLRMGHVYHGRVREVRQAGNTPLTPDTLVVSLGPAIQGRYSMITPGAVLQVSTASVPGLRGVRTAISGGPVLLRAGKREKIRNAYSQSYEFSSMSERHPRTAIGWNQEFIYLVEVDGRQRDLSDGMTLDEMSAYLAKLGCTEAFNFDGGGSATLWYQGEVRNSPCDGRERDIANSLVVVRRKSKSNERAHAITPP